MHRAKIRFSAEEQAEAGRVDAIRTSARDVIQRTATRGRGDVPVFRFILGLWLMALSITVVASFQTAASERVGSPGGVFPLTVTDDAGRKVLIKREPLRIVSLAPSNTELIYALGLEHKLVGIDNYSDYPPETREKEKVGGLVNPSLEKIVSLAPDLLLATNLHVKRLVPELEKRGLTVVVFQPARLEGMLDNLLTLGRIGGKPETADRVVENLRRRIEAVTARTRDLRTRPRVFFELSPDLITAGPGTFIGDMIGKAGGESIARDAEGSWPKLSSETVVLRDPEIVLLADHGSSSAGVTVEMVRGRPGWRVVSAVRTGRIVPLPDLDVVNRPGPRAVDGLEFLARVIHPELFR